MSKLTCEKCGRLLDEKEFYTYKNGEKTKLCKKCLTLHIDNFEPSTFLWALKEMDVPYIEGEWNILRDKAFAKNPNTMNGMSVFGKYLSKMKLKQWNQYGWEDTERLQAQEQDKNKAAAAEQEAREQRLQEQFDAGEISEYEFKTLMSTKKQAAAATTPGGDFLGNDNPYVESNFISSEELPDPAAMLTQEDKISLALKWGRLYQVSEWVELEKMYTEMINSFDIQDADSKNTLILLCKTNLKANQAIDSGDIEGFQKLSKVAESLRKSAKFTAAQNKEQKSDFVDSVGELVVMCERDGFIPRFCTDIPQDKVDKTLQDMNNYVYKLVTQDLGFGQQIEDSLKKIQLQKEMNAAAEAAEERGELVPELDDEDYVEYYNQVQKEREADAALFSEEEEE